MVQVHHDEEVANRIDPGSCAAACEGIGEALTGDRTGQPLSRESTLLPGADVVPLTEGNTDVRGNPVVHTAICLKAFDDGHTLPSLRLGSLPIYLCGGCGYADIGDDQPPGGPVLADAS